MQGYNSYFNVKWSINAQKSCMSGVFNPVKLSLKSKQKQMEVNYFCG